MTYRIAASQLQRLRKFALSEQKSAQREVGGLILSSDGLHLKLAFLANEALPPCQFRVSESAYKAAKDRAERRGQNIVGTFHSHPISEAIPGERDIKWAASGSLMLIYDVCGREAKLWRIRKLRGHFRATELTRQTSGRAPERPPDSG